MGSPEKRSQWHDEQAWGERLQHDQDLLRERIGHEQQRSLGTFVAMLDGEIGMIDFLVVYGKAAREGLESAKDVDFFFEAERIRAHPEQHIEVDREHEGVRFHAYGWPSGALLHNLRAGEGFAFGVVRDALIFVDRGTFREALAAVDEDSLELAPGESMDKSAQPPAS
jgi:hypothetical protein